MNASVSSAAAGSVDPASTLPALSSPHERAPDHGHGHDHGRFAGHGHDGASAQEIGHGHAHGHDHEHGHGGRGREVFSLVRASVATRLAIAGSLSALIWAAVVWARLPLGS